jgi:hypothetical protein
MQVVYRAQNLIDAHLAKHLLEDAGLPAFVFGESLLGGAGELPMIGVLRVCVPDGYEAEAAACLQVLSDDSDAAAGDEDPEAFGTIVGAT